MKKHNLNQANIAVLSAASDQEACKQICEALTKDGATVHAITLDGSMPEQCRAQRAVKLDDADESMYRSLVVIADENGRNDLTGNPSAKTLATAFFRNHKPVSSTCDGTLMLGDFGLIEGREVSIDHDLTEQAEKRGARVMDSPMTTHQGFTSASPRVDLVGFIDKIAEEAEEGKHPNQHA